MARFVAGARFGRLLAIGGLIAVGWFLGVVFGFAGAAAADVPAAHMPVVKAVKAVTTGKAVKVMTGKAVKVATGKAVKVATGKAVKVVETVAAHGFLSTTPLVAPGSAPADGFPTVSDSVPADAGAMAGRNVDGLTSQSKPALPAPSTADHSAGANGFVPRGGGSGPFGPSVGDVARSVFDPRLMVAPAETASAPAPVVRTAADDPSFSPD
ncbi:hypothetical protein GCM10022226_06470 [Sphaerisporangium flaviroseum]|uniref:DUF5666 domain-containing protein n=1 Tax=Sphaerisporangium flaviroseum TaxID=509199 RepID=A0ABP7HF43_9ACTN